MLQSPPSTSGNPRPARVVWTRSATQHCEHGDPFRVEHVRVGVTRRAIRRDIDADDFGGLEKPMQTGFPERVWGVLHSARMESESGRHLDDSELRSRPRGQSMTDLVA